MIESFIEIPDQLADLLKSAGSAPPPRPLNRNIAVYGDSRAFQCTKGNVGLAFWASALSGGLAAFPTALNAGVDGDTTAQQVARMPLILAQAANFDVLIHFGTGNDRLQGMSIAQTISNLNFIYDTLLARGKTIITIAETPVHGPGIGVGASVIADHYMVHQWLLNEAPKKGILVANPWDKMVDPASGASYLPLPGMVGDGVHPSPMGGEVIGAAVAEVLGKIFSNRVTLPTANLPFSSSPAATANLSGSLIPNPLLTGTTGTVTAGSGGTITSSGIAANCVLSGTNLAGLTVTPSKLANSTAGDFQVLKVSGTPTGNNPTLVLEQSIPVASLFANEVIKAFGKWELTSASNSVLQVALQLQAVNGAGTTTLYQSGQNQELAHPIAAGQKSGIFETQALTITEPLTSLKVRLVASFVKGAAQDVTIKLAQVDARQAA
ncbi:SGNH/GDSL hydrolase family protein [Pseudomonas aeruginosa]|uniref:SGNH/GDSL hydrolase family protein n=1 Tax=Pseudomonas aeruginosa TaxID=287 RepID=UPI00287E904D|nr:SGNH/GDSL hydrolase family protein [Pseudomonas aeruginosa]MDS9411581.1 SGNH/GDSL hydrolase family protein [Pseudomonas aeruginosa]MDS9424844.1 SGNH/GDSL hydrolase family protein [Pseudomonas aeruginosa]MDS9459035.1 SGNH/GDSL hydrolase family protein [Pseudomonas aeruginosa]MDS9493951.1 SGNH/GDSL hydrolase family protein [Pseudomonas aeruginosa]MDS9754361.1 SGNH/GDSL hydrolase family protein [Pseudomonas aeruginosa]